MLGQDSAKAAAGPMTLDIAAGRYWTEVIEPRCYGAIPGESEHRRHARARQAGTTKWHFREILAAIGKATLLRDIDTAAAVQFVLDRRAAPGKQGRTLSTHTINSEIVLLCETLDRARKLWREPDVGEIDRAELRRLLPRAAGRKVRISKEQARTGLAAMLPHARGPVQFALNTGLRKENVVHLDWAEVDLEARAVVVRVKGGKLHGVMLVPEAHRLLATLQPDPARRVGPVWRFGQVPCPCAKCTGAAGERRDPIRDIDKQFGRFRAAIGMPALTIHGLRHTAASWLHDEGKSTRYAKQILGHENEATTAGYTHLVDADVAAVASVALSFMDEPGPKLTKEGAAS